MRIEITDLVDELLDVNGRDVLDVGCGDGWLVRRLASAGARVIGMDPLDAALQRARAADPEGIGGGSEGNTSHLGGQRDHADGRGRLERDSDRYVRGGAQALPFRDASFDVVVFFNSLHHVPEDAMDKALAEAARVLRPSGILYVQEPLAHGELFELLRAIDDETAVRAEAQAALDRASQGSLVELTRREATAVVRIADFEALRQRIAGVEPSRAAAIDASAAELHAAFQRLGKPGDGCREFDQPVRVYLFTHASRPRRG